MIGWSAMSSSEWVWIYAISYVLGVASTFPIAAFVLAHRPYKPPWKLRLLLGLFGIGYAPVVWMLWRTVE